MIWVEKYRPENLDEIVGQREIILDLKQMLKKPNELPHLLFWGPSGTGKTSTACCVAKAIYGFSWRKYVLEINAIDLVPASKKERDEYKKRTGRELIAGLDSLREKIKPFSEFAIIGGAPYKLIVVEDAHMMTSEMQHGLRRLMEIYAPVTRFCLISDSLEKIIEPIRSRCVTLRFKKISLNETSRYLKKICSLEKISFEEEALNKIYLLSNGDLRKAILLLQLSVRDGKISTKTINSLNREVSVEELREVLIELRKKSFNRARRSFFKILRSTAFEAPIVLNALLLAAEDLDLLNERIVEKIAETDYKIAKGGDEEIQFIALLADISQMLTNDR